MKRNRAVLTAVVIVVLLVAGWFIFRRSRGGTAIDLLSIYATATKAPAASAFDLVDVEVNGEKKRAIFTTPPSRLTWKVRVPDDAWLKLSVATKPETWDKEGDGVLFFVGVSDGRAFDQLFTLHVDPHANPGERRWIPVTADLSSYAGEEVDIIFNTRNSPPNKGDDRRNDAALWGTPELVIR
jgi:hypothetical protein